MTAVNDWDDLQERLIRAAGELDHMSTDADETEFVRLRAKRSGVLLALDYMRGYRNPQPAQRITACAERATEPECNGSCSDLTADATKRTGREG